MISRRKFLKSLSVAGATLAGARLASGSPVSPGKRKHVNHEANWLIEPRFDKASFFKNGLAAVRVGTAWGYVDTTGTFVIPPRFDYAASFENCHGNKAYVVFDSMRGYIGRDGSFHRESPELRAWMYCTRFIDGDPDLIAPRADGEEVYSLDVSAKGKRGYINEDLEIIIEPTFDDAWFFGEGLANVKSGDTWGYIDRAGMVVLDFQYDETSVFREGFAQVKKGDRRMVIDRAGNIIRSSLGERYSGFSEGLAGLRSDRSKMGFIGTNGNVVIEPRFDRAHGFEKGRAVVEANGKYGVIERTGEFVIVPRFESFIYFTEGDLLHFSVGEQTDSIEGPVGGSYPMGEKHGYANARGEVVIPPQFDCSCGFQEGLSPARVKDKWGYIDTAGQWAILPMFDSWEDFSGGMAAARVGDKWGYIARP
jgi:hypothetical protein